MIFRRLFGKQPPPDADSEEQCGSGDAAQPTTQAVAAEVPAQVLSAVPTPSRLRFSPSPRRAMTNCAQPRSPRSRSRSPRPSTAAAAGRGPPAPGSPFLSAATPKDGPARSVSPPRRHGRQSAGRESTGRCRRSLARRRSSAAMLRCRQSFPHRDFENPEAETCWLSCLFQSLWHSVIFHRAFEEYLATPKHEPSGEERILAALQQTWEEYQAASARQAPGDLAAAVAARTPELPGALAGRVAGGGAVLPLAAASAEDWLVPADDLVEAFGEGYGDMSEALALMQDELSQSSHPAAKRLSELLVLVPLALQGDDGGEDASALPSPGAAWSLVEEWQSTSSPLIAVDLSLPRPTSRDGSRRLAELWVPAARHAVDASKASADLGSGHHLVCLVCFMWNMQHYVAFCQRQSDPSRCIFFNDLPELTRGAPREVNWKDVPAICGAYALTPRLVLYECSNMAEAVSLDPAALFST